LFRVVLAAETRRELRKLHNDIARKRSRRIAEGYIRRLKKFIQGLAIAPHRGQHRPGIRADQRTIGFERRVSVIFNVSDKRKVVNVVGIRYAGQELDTDDE
jgi:toxin ParE1/3/4